MHPELMDSQTEITAQADGESYTVHYEDVPLRTVNPKERISARRMADIPYTGDVGIRLGDVYHGTHTMEEFVFDCNSGGVAHQHCMDVMIAEMWNE